MHWWRWLIALMGISGGLGLFLWAPYPFPVRLSLALLLVMAGLWLSELIPLWVTALLPLLVTALAHDPTLPLVQISAQYASPIIWLFMATFILGFALHHYQIDAWVSIWLLRRLQIASARRVLLLFLSLAAFFSMWMSNTVVTAMLLPLVLTVVPSRMDVRPYLLAIAWGSSIGGIATLIGTPPNGIATGFLQQQGIEIDFLFWFVHSLPVTFLLAAAAYWLLRPTDNTPIVHLPALNLPILRPQARFIAGFIAIVFLLWLIIPLLAMYFPLLRSLKTWLIGLAAVILLLSLRFKGAPLLPPAKALQHIHWDILLLFGGGLALSKMLTLSGSAQLLADLLGRWVHTWHPVALLAFLALLTNFLTELTSNTATSAVLIPIFLPVFEQMGLDPVVATLPIAYSASLAFMLPIATPPNAIVYATGRLSIPYMVRKGFIMNLLGWVIIVLWVLWH